MPTLPGVPRAFLSYEFLVKCEGGGQPRAPLKVPGQTDYAPVTLSRGIVTDVVFEQWLNRVFDTPNTGRLGSEMALTSFRKNIDLEPTDSAQVPES